MIPAHRLADLIAAESVAVVGASNDPARIGGRPVAFLLWFIVDKEGKLIYARVTDPRGLVPNDEMLEVLEKHK